MIAQWPCRDTNPATPWWKSSRPSPPNIVSSRDTGQFPANFLRHYYDVYCLLDQPDVQAFIGTDAYRAHKDRRFPRLDNPDISGNPAFSLSDPETFALYERAYERTAALYYHDRPSPKEILARIACPLHSPPAEPPVV